MEDDQVSTTIRLPEGRINILIPDPTFSNSAHERFAAQYILNFRDRDAVLLFELFNELFFPNDFPNDHGNGSYHPPSDKE